MNVPAVVNPHVAALARRCAEAESLARVLCESAGFEPETRTRNGFAAWRLFVEQAHGLRDLMDKRKA